MLRNYIKTTFRNMKKHKGYSFINIAGLAIGVACCILILLWVRDELSFDGFNEKADRLYRVVEMQYYAGGAEFPVAVTPGPLAQALKDELPEVLEVMRWTAVPRFLVRRGERVFYEENIGMADPSLFSMFSYPLIKGDPQTALTKLPSIVLSESMAEKYFGENDPIGEVLRIENQFNLTVTGVMEDVPGNSHLQFDCVVPFKLQEMGGRRLDQWGNNSFYTYVELAENADAGAVDEKVRDYIKKNNQGSNTTLHLQLVRDIHLHSDFTADVPGHGDIKYIYIFSLVAIFVLLIACINFMNLTTARSSNRAREVGMRKVTGAQRIDIIWQFLGEALLFVLTAFVLALGLVLLLLPAFSNLSGKSLTINLADNLDLLVLLVGMAVVTGMVSGSYPALFLSSFQPVKVLKGGIKSGPRSTFFRRVLVVLQFSLSIFLVIATVVIHSQLEYIRNKKLGYVKEQVLYSRFGVNSARFFEAFQREALSHPGILGVSTTDQLPTYMVNSSSSVNWPGKDPNDTILFHNNGVGYDFLDVMQMRLIEGRNFSREFPTDAKEAYIVNQAAAEVMGESSPVGKSFSQWGNQGKIIGVVEDFHFKSLNTQVEPLVLRLTPAEPYGYLMVRIGAADIAANVRAVEEAWRKAAPQFPFETRFLDDEFDSMYRAEQRMGKLFNAFTSLAIFIACLGLLGLASFMAEQRTKEIGIRKVLGASAGNIVLLLSREFLLLVGIANVVAWPAAYYFMRRWLENYAYHADISVLIFAASAVLALVIALLTVSYQSLKAATADPVESLRYE